MINFKPADIILTQSKGYLGKVILWILRFFQDDPVNFNHALMVCSKLHGIEADKTIRYVNLNDTLKKAKVYKIIRRIDLTDNQRDRLVEKAKLCFGQKYGYKRLVMQLLDQVFHTDWFTENLRLKKHICSTIVSWSYFAVCKIKFNGINWMSVEPDDIDDCVEKNPDLYITWMVEN